jgi:YVTN family beta-propeller protein
VDVHTWTVTDSVKLGGFPFELCCIPGANSVVYYDPYQYSVHLVNADSSSRVADVLAGPPLYYDSVADRVYCGRVTIDPTSGRALPGFRLSENPSVMCGNTVGGKLYLVVGDTILALNQTTGERTTVSRVPGIGQSRVAPCYEPSTDATYFVLPHQYAVLVVDSRTASVVDTIPLDNTPSYLCSNPGSRKVYCASPSDAGVTVVNSVTRKVIATVKLEVPDTTRLVSGTRELIVKTTSGDRPCYLCSVSSDSSVYCAGAERGLLYVIDGTSDAVAATIPVPPGSHQLLYSAHTNKLYCTNDDNTLSVIDVSSREVIGRIAVGERAQAPALNPWTHLLYVPNCFGSSISVIRDE